jgi:hypothetical protein
VDAVTGLPEPFQRAPTAGTVRPVLVAATLDGAGRRLLVARPDNTVEVGRVLPRKSFL